MSGREDGVSWTTLFTIIITVVGVAITLATPVYDEFIDELVK